MRTWPWLAGAGLTGVVLSGLLGAGTATGQTHVNWPRYLYSLTHASDNQLATSITLANASQLKLAWKFTPDATLGSGLGGFLSSPTVYNGVVYIGARNGYFYAINDSTGAVLWQRFIGYVAHKTCGPAGFTSTATVAPDQTTGNPTVYVYGATGFLYAMKAATGADVWPPAKVAVPSATKSDYYAWSSPLVFGGNVYVGISSQCDRPLVRAGLDRFKQATGTLKGTFWTTPSGTRGASIWSSPAADSSSVYITTGNGPAASKGESIIELGPRLAQRGIWAVPAAQRASDSDFGASPGIWTASIGGTPTEMVGACNKNGTFYALQASDLAAGPTWQLPIGNPYPQGPGQCDAAPVFDGSNLYLAGNGTTINGTAYDGSLLRVNPATGAVAWHTGLTGSLIGTPGMNGAGVIAAASYGSTTNHNGVFLINAATGQILKTIPYVKSKTFGQPVFADDSLFVASANGLRAYTAG